MQPAQFVPLPPNCSVMVNPGCRVLMRPLSYVEGEPLVTYNIGMVAFSIPQRALVSEDDNFLAKQLVNNTTDIDTAEAGNIKVRLHDPVFQDPQVFSLILDFFNRRLDMQASTLRQANTVLTKPQWENLIELERFVLTRIDRNPYWSGYTSRDFTAHGNVTQTPTSMPKFNIGINPHWVVVEGRDGFALRVDVASITNPPVRPISLLKGNKMGFDMEFPFHVDFKTYHFVPHNAIVCKIEGKLTVCEGTIHSNGYLRIEPVDVDNFTWFNFEINPRMIRNDVYLYGEHD